LPSFSPSRLSAGVGLRTVANFSWISVVLSVALNVILMAGGVSAHSREAALVQGSIAIIFLISGVICAIVALYSIPKYGTKGLLWPALSGIVIWVLLIVLAIPSFLLARNKALKVQAARAKMVALAPVTHLPGAQRVQDSELGFVFELPQGFTAIPPESKPKQYRYAFIKPGVGEANSVVTATGVGGAFLAGRHLKSIDVPQGLGNTLVTFSWRGLDIDCLRVPEKTAAGDYVTFNVQVPLKKQAIQIGFGGPASSEALIKARAEQVLSTLEGEVNW
jgi:hypothetical protein